jgi:DNA-binding transcriptional MerR regulator
MSEFNLKAVLRQTGLTAETLRAWERRYSAVSPGRSENGRRVYDSADVHRLQLLATLTRRGFRIGDIANLSEKELMRRIEASHDPSDIGTRSKKSQSVSELIDALDRFDFDQLRVLLARVRYQISPRDFALELVPALMFRVGTLIVEGRFSIAQEHALSQLVQSELRQIYDSLKPLEDSSRNAKTMIFGTREGDYHDIGLMLAALLCRGQGIRCQYLGPNLPSDSLADAVKTLKPSAVVIGLSFLPEEERVSPQDFVNAVDKAILPGTELWLGGSASGQVKRPRSKRTIWIFESLIDLEAKLNRSLSQRA